MPDLFLSDYLTILFSFPLYRLVHWIVTGSFYWKRDFNDDRDIFRENIRAYIQELDKKYFSHWMPPLALGLALGAIPWLQWAALDPAGNLRLVILGTMMIIGWNLSTRDIDLATGETYYKERLLLLASVAGACFSPFFIPLYLSLAFLHLRGWSHHQELGLRLLLFFVAAGSSALLVSAFARSAPAFLSDDIFIVLLIALASHFFAPGVAKLRIGPKPYTWVLEGRLSDLVASCFMWGWRPFYFKNWFAGYYRLIRKYEVPLQAGALLMELSAAWILLNVSLSVIILLLIILFLLSVFATTGLLFLEHIFICACFLGGIYLLPQESGGRIFNPLNGFFGALILSHLIFRYKLWRPKKLTWWNTPFVGIIELQVQGESGKWFRLSNDFMCPHERIFGQLFGISLSKERRITLHTGELKDYSLSNMIVQTNGDKAHLEFLKDNFGICHYDREKAAVYEKYMTAFISHYNLGWKKRVCPKFLKFPGEQRYYDGEHPRFRGDEKIVKLKIFYKEEYYDGKQAVPLKREELREYSFEGKVPREI